MGLVTFTAGASLSASDAVTLLVVLLPTPSWAVTAMTLAPSFSAIAGIDHAVVPVAVPLPPRSLTQVTCVTVPSSLAVPLIAMVALAVEWFDVPGVTIDSDGDWPSDFVTVSTSVAMLPPASRAVTVMMLVPTLTGTDATLHVVVPVAVPLPPTVVGPGHLETPPSSVAVPPSAIVAADVV